MVASVYTWKMVKKYITTRVNVTLLWKKSEVSYWGEPQKGLANMLL